jgi:hypothetical protein
MERDIIRVEVPCAHAPIAAALRRAFAPVSGDAGDRDFYDLLRKLS